MKRPLKNKRGLKAYFADFVVIFIKLILRLRYKVTLVGLEEAIKSFDSTKGGILFLPNHPAQMDPLILVTYLWRRFRVTGVMLDSYYYLFAVHFLSVLVGAIPLPVTSEFMNKWRKKRVDDLYQRIIEGLAEEENFLIYPSGKLKSGPKETIGGTSLIYNLLQRVSKPKIVLVRFRGLWGSQFSKAYTVDSPNVLEKLFHSVKVLLKNGIFFVPKRHVYLEFAHAPEDFPFHAKSRLELNRYMENWYNAPWGEKGEPLNQVSYSFWKKDVLTPLEKIETVLEEDIEKVPQKIQEQVLAKIAEISERPVSEISPLANLSTDLGLDSLDFMHVSLFLDQHYDVVGFPVTELRSVKDVMLVAAGYKERPRGIEKEERKNVSLVQKKRPSPLPPRGKTVQEAFLASCDRMKGFMACTDEVSGSLSYHTLRRAVLVLAQKIRKLPGQHVGILLPSSVGSYLIIFATLFSGKIPVMLNWTVGVRNLDFANDLLKLQTVITSQKFLENLDVDDLGKIEEHFVKIEDLKKSLSLFDKVKGLITSYFSSNQIKRMFDLNKVSENDPCVILFTSGSESLPKAVPLSHKNIISNESAAVESIFLKRTDVFYGVLPPFHSFGFSVTGLLPILSGLNVVYAPDPTDNYGILRDIRHYGITIFCCAPSFIKAVFHIAKPEKLSSVRLFAAGAEKTPDELFTYVDQLPKKPTMVEGYGITECSPVVCINRPKEIRKGIGKPLPNVRMCTIGLETNAILPPMQEGEICIHGPSVFGGYIGTDRDPFIILSGKKWYRSGDLGYIDGEGNVFLSGRISRFIKMGGEMVSLGGIEQELLQIAKEKNWYREGETQSLAVVARERDSAKPEIVLFSTVPLEKEDVNVSLRNHGYGRLAKINEVKIIDSIPFTGTGKVHYRILEEMLKNPK